MIAVPGGVKILVATKPVDVRKGADGLAAMVREQLRHDPFSGTIFIFRSKRAQLSTFYIRFSFRDDHLSLASTVRTNAPGVAIPARQGFDLHLHR
jgi:transposase